MRQLPFPTGHRLVWLCCCPITRHYTRSHFVSLPQHTLPVTFPEAWCGVVADVQRSASGGRGSVVSADRLLARPWLLVSAESPRFFTRRTARRRLCPKSTRRRSPATSGRARRARFRRARAPGCGSTAASGIRSRERVGKIETSCPTGRSRHDASWRGYEATVNAYRPQQARTHNLQNGPGMAGAPQPKATRTYLSLVAFVYLLQFTTVRTAIRYLSGNTQKTAKRTALRATLCTTYVWYLPGTRV